MTDLLRYRLFIILTALAVLPLSVLPQDGDRIDSLRRLAVSARGDSLSLLLGSIAKQYSYFLPDSAIDIGGRGIVIAKEHGFLKGEAVNLYAVGNAYFTQSRYADAWRCFDQALTIGRTLGDQALIAEGLLNTGNVYYYQGEKQRALDSYRQSLAIGETLHDTTTLASASVNIGCMSLDRGEFADGIRILSRAALYFAALGDRKGLSYCNRNIAVAHQMQGKDADAEPYLRRALADAEATGNKEVISGSLQVFSDIFRLKGEYQRSIGFGLRALDLATEINDLPYVKGAASTLALSYEASGDLKNALKYHRLARAAEDSLRSADRSRELQRMQHQHELDLKEHEIELLEQRSTNQQLLAGLLATGGAAAVVVIVLVQRSFRRERRSRLRLSVMNEEKEHLIAELTQAMEQIRTLDELLPICSNCKKIRDDQGYWQSVDRYITEHTSTKFSHGICPECIEKLYPDQAARIRARMSASTPAVS